MLRTCAPLQLTVLFQDMFVYNAPRKTYILNPSSSSSSSHCCREEEGEKNGKPDSTHLNRRARHESNGYFG